MYPPASLDRPQDHALFLDFDGTLCELAPRPELIQLDASVMPLLRQCLSVFENAVAIVSGRPVEQLDRFLAPLSLPVGALHGVTVRDASGSLTTYVGESEELAAVRAELARFAEATEGLWLEDKGSALALHYRANPTLREDCLDFAATVVANRPDLTVIDGKMVVEIKSRHANKGTALRVLLGSTPFLGRKPIFAGDDRTDEDAFAVVNDLGGLSIKVGGGRTTAQYRVPDVSALRNWLKASVSMSAEEDR